jgi:K(+)-stimulated pyrophosphate-energized sodium pump
VFGVVAPELLTGFALGFALVALLLRLSGSMHNEAAAAAVARQVSQGEGDTTQQERNNTAVLAEMVGDSAGNSAGIASTILGSLTVVFVASLILGLQLGDHLDGEPGDNLYDLRFFIYPLFTYGTMLVAGLIGNALVRTDEKRRNAMAALKRGFNISAFVVALAGLIITILYMEETAEPGFSVEWRPYCNVFGGIVLALLLHKSTEYFTSTRHRLVKGVSRAAQSGSVPGVTSGLALSFESVVWAVIVVAGATLSSASIYRDESGEIFLLFVLYGVALTGLGMLTLAGSTIAIESFGAVTSSARKLGQLAALDKNARNALEDLDVVGTSGQMMARGLANGAAALGAISVFGAFAASTMLASEPFISINIAKPLIFVALMLGAAFPLLFSTLALRLVARAAARMARVAGQNTAPADAAQEKASAADTRPISSASSATRGPVIGLGVAALVVPALIVVLLEPEGLSAFLVGTVLSALLLTISHANAGGAWGNARRYIEDGFYGGKNSPTQAAAQVSDTVGGALRATTGVILAPLLTLVGVVVLIFGPVQLRLEPLSPVNMGVMALSLALLALVFWWSRREPEGEAKTSAKPQATRTTSSKKRSREMAREREREREKEDTV